MGIEKVEKTTIDWMLEVIHLKFGDVGVRSINMNNLLVQAGGEVLFSIGNNDLLSSATLRELADLLDEMTSELEPVDPVEEAVNESPVVKNSMRLEH